jgi:hypothetical protein
MVYAPVGMPLDNPALEPLHSTAAEFDLAVVLHALTVMPARWTVERALPGNPRRGSLPGSSNRDRCRIRLCPARRNAGHDLVEDQHDTMQPGPIGEMLSGISALSATSRHRSAR